MSSTKICRTIRPIYAFFMVENILEPRLQLLSHVVQKMIYVGIINGIDFSALFPAFSTSVAVFIGLLILCLIKFWLKVALRFGISFILLQMIVQRGGMWLPANIFLLSMLSIAQLVGCISFDYSSEAVHSESKAENKVIWLLLMMINIALLTYAQDDTYIHLASAVLFLVAFISKATSLIKNQAYRETALRFYLWTACQHLRQFTNAFIPTSTPTFFIFALLFSQASFSLIERCKATVNCHELLAKEERLKLAFILLRYAHASTFDPELQKFVSTFIEDAGQADELSKQRIEMSQNSGMNASKQRLCQAVLNLLNKSNGFLEELLKAEIHAENGRLFVAVQGLARISERLSLYEWLCKILVLRAYERIQSKFERVSACAILAHEKEWLAYLSFQSLLHRASSQHLKFNLYLRKAEIELTKVKQMCKKIISIDSEAARAFQKVRNGFSVSTELFVSFLAKVRGDFVGAQQILSRQRLREKQLLDGGCQQKIYIRLGLSAEGLTICRVGFNARQLLGFNRADLEGQKVQRLVPSFFRSQHQRISTAFIRESFERALLFQKKTVVLNGQGNYNLCAIILRLRLDQSGSGEETFCFEGYLHVTPSQRHNLQAVFVVNSRGLVVESSDGLFQDAEDTSLKVQQLFDGNIGQMLSRTNDKHLYQVYEPVLCLGLQQTFYFYVRRLQRRRENTLVQGSVLTEMAAPLMKCKQQSIKLSLARSDQIQAGIRGKQIVFLFVLTIFLILCLFGSEYLMIVSALVKYNNQNFAVINFRNLIKYYNATQTLNLNLVYVDLRDNYNYSNPFFLLTMEESAASLQKFNENLKQFNLGRYKLPTYNSKISYQQSNYELIMMLVSQNYLYRKFSNDPFARKLILDQSKLVTSVITTQSIADYRASIFNLMTSFVENDLFYERLSFGVSMANILVFTLIALRLFCKLRALEEYALEKRCEGTFYHRKIADILDFMRQISLQQVGIDKINRQMHIFELASRPQTQSSNNSYLQSEASLIKETTGRDMMGDTLNKTGFLDDLQKVEHKKKPQSSQAHTFKKSESHRMVLVFFGIFMAILAGLDVTNEIVNYRIKNLDEVNSLNGVLTLFKTNGYYTSRGVTVTLNTILLKNQKGYDNSAAFSSLIQSLYAYIATFSLPVFSEVLFPEFADFGTNLSLLYQSPICSYIPCDSQYQDEINLNFISVISKYSANLSSMVKTTSNFTQQQLTNYLATNKRYIDLLFYTEMILRRFISNLIMLYLDSHIQFMENLYSNKLGYIYTMMAVTALGLASFLLFIWRVRKEQDIFIRMVRIYQEPIAEA